MRSTRFITLLRIALVAGLLIDGVVGVLALLAQPLIPALLDVPVKDPAITTIAGGELIVVAGVYALVARDPSRWQAMLWLCALDQAFAVALPALEIARGHVPATVKTIAPMPFQALLVVIYVAGALNRAVRRSGSPFVSSRWR